MTAPGLTLLQALLWPDPQLCPDPGLTLRLRAGARLNGQGIGFDAGGAVDFDTAFNLFPLAKWRKFCALDDLRLALRGEGRFQLTVSGLGPEPCDILTCEVDLSEFPLIDLTPALHRDAPVLAIRLRALTPGHLKAAEWQTAQTPLCQPKIVLGITTFHREAAVSAAAARFAAFAKKQKDLHLVVVDNGQSLRLPALEGVTVIPSRNLGGAGGFARCLHAARDIGASHAIFMDDDAAIDMGAIARVRAFLSYATDPATAVYGGLTQGADPTRIFESGATFRLICRPLHRGLDLTSTAAAVALESETFDKPFDFYAGFWFLAFPLAAVRHEPFPFFVRGDDIAFSLSNPFRFTTLPGVICFQDQDFAAKEGALTLYLELRNHLIQHLALPQIALSRWQLARIAMIFFGRSLLQHHVDSLRALNLAIEDVLRGPGYFATHADLAERRAEIAAQAREEVWRPLTKPPETRQRINPQARVTRAVLLATLNGLFLPFYASFANHITLSPDQRGRFGPALGASQISYVDARGQRTMTVRQNKRALLAQALRGVGNVLRLLAGHKRLEKQWRTGFAALTSAAFWDAEFQRRE